MYYPSDYSTITFPSLGISWDPGRGVDLGPLHFQFYGIIIACGLLLAVLYGLRRCKTFGLTQDDILDGVLCVTPFAILCARLYYCVFSWELYADNPISILYIWEGGLAIYGGVLGAALGVAVFCLVKRIRLTALLDLVSIGFLIGQCIGRWGNFFNREAFGAETETFLRMGLYNVVTGSFQYFHPTFLYESLWNFVGFLALHFLVKHRKYDGQIALCYVAWYGLGRTFIEGLRTDSLMWGPFRVSQMLAAISCLAAVAVLAIQAFREHDPEKLYVNCHPAEAAEEEIPAEASEAPAETEE